MTFSEFLTDQGFERGKQITIKGIFDNVFKTTSVKVENYKFTDGERLWLLNRAFLAMEQKLKRAEITIRTHEYNKRKEEESKTPLFSDWKPISKSDIESRRETLQ